MVKRKVGLVVLCLLAFTVGCSSTNTNDVKNNISPGVSTPMGDAISLIDSEIEDDLLKISQNVLLSVTVDDDRIMRMTLTNNTSQVIDYGYTLYLEKKIDGNWFRLIEKVPYADAGYELQPNDKFEQNAELDNWEGTNTGIFRAYKVYSCDKTKPASETEEFSVSNEFEIKE